MDHVLYFCASPAVARATQQALEGAAARLSPARAGRVRVSYESSAARALIRLRSGGLDLLVVDARGDGGDLGGGSS